MKFFSKLGSVHKLIIPVVGIGALIVFATLFMYEVTQSTVDISHDGETQTVKTHSNSVAALFEEVGIEVGEHDKLSNRMDEAIESGMKIDIQTATLVIIEVDNIEHELYTTAATIEEFFQEEDISFSERDIVSHELTAPIEEGLVFVATTASEMTIVDGGEKVKVWTTGESVSDLLSNNDIKLNEHDRILEGKEKDGKLPITIVRVDKKIKKEEKTIPFKEEQRTDSTLEKGKTKVLAEGKEGKLEVKHEITLEDGKEADRSVLEEKVLKKSEKRIVAVGTKEPEIVTLAESKPKAESNQTSTPKTETKSETNTTPKTEAKTETETKVETKAEEKAPATPPKKEEPASEPSGGKEFTMSATAYTAKCTGCSGITATGINLNANPNMKVVAVDPNVIPLGSRVWVSGYGEAIAGDTGGAIKGNKIDLHFPTQQSALSFGRRTVTVKIIE